MPRVFVGIGSNIDRERSIRAGVADLRCQYREVQLSSVYESDAVGFEGNAFFNLVAAFDTDDSIEQVVASLTHIEDRHGRVRNGERFAARTLDLDLLLYGQQIIATENYHVPRDEILRYAFVLWPLAEMAPTDVHPEVGESYAVLWEKFDKRNQVLRPISFEWQVFLP
ncbi:MAG: 2-amino-4-hydroxy-6-hydroxymethyldihydropteridine diphosphokinase [Gammaproteobacteria bacterium]|nr:2-amino-4-hydroxy-6-hydroxymethyldihydropteridine diphosphokinase [Gammaproteobacteria bacterium]